MYGASFVNASWRILMCSDFGLSSQSVLVRLSRPMQPEQRGINALHSHARFAFNSQELNSHRVYPFQKTVN